MATGNGPSSVLFEHHFLNNNRRIQHWSYLLKFECLHCHLDIPVYDRICKSAFERQSW